MNEIFLTSSYFGIALTILMFWISSKIAKKLKFSFINPILMSGLIIIAILLIFNIDYETYESSAGFLTSLLTPATICYAVPLYRQLNVLKKNVSAIIISVLCGSFSSIAVVFVFSKLFGFDSPIYHALLPKSVTTAIGISLSNEMGGIIAITITSIMITGLFGSAAAVAVCRLFRITHPVAKGLAIGTASHAVGTSKAIEIGEVEGAMSSLAIVIAGLSTVLWASIASGWI